MSVSGLTITLSSCPRRAGAACRRLGAHRGVELGPRAGRRLAATADTPSPDADRRLLDWIEGLEGVEHVDVVFVHFDDDAGAAAPATISPEPGP